MNALWVSLHESILARGYWDQQIVEELLSFPITHYEGGFDEIPVDDATFVIIPARWHINDIEKINRGIAQFPVVFIFLTGDEEGVFPWTLLEHPHMKVWVQTPYRSKHEGVDGKFGDGAPPGCRQILKTLDTRRSLPWMFAGQINNPIRESCYRALRARMDHKGDGFLKVTKIFGSGLEYHNYLGTMKEAKIAICPSGTFTPDTFRLYEALEAGCVPIVDVGPNPDEDYWNFLFTNPVPFPVIRNYEDDLSNAIDNILRTNFNDLVGDIQNWWFSETTLLRGELSADLVHLQRSWKSA